MNKQELSAMVAEILQGMGKEPMVKGSDYKPTDPGPEAKDCHFQDGDFVEDVTALDLRKLYLVEDPADAQKYRRLKEKGVLVRWFDADRIRDYVRITVGSMEQLKVLVDMLDRVAEEV